MDSFDAEIESQLADIKRQAHDMAKVQSDIALRGLVSPYADNKITKGKASVSDKLMAIQDIYDLQERTNISFIILGDLAKTIREKIDYYNGDIIEFGFYARNLVPEIRSLFKTWNFEEMSFGYKYYFTPPTKWDVKIPIIIHCFTKHWDFFDNPDVGFFGVDEYKLPNPFNDYWALRTIFDE